MYPDNILMWPDGFWCFREELDPKFLRGDDYRVITHGTDEWREIEAKGYSQIKKPAG